MFISKRNAVIILLVCVCFAFLVYNPADFYFLNDDFVHILLTQKGEFFQHRSTRPVHELLLLFDIRLWGKNAFGYHLSLLLIHLLCSFFVFALAALFFERYGNIEKNKARNGAMLAAALFVIYAFHSEAVLWILGGGASLGGLFFLMSLVAYIKKEKIILYPVAVICFQLSLFTYESSWIGPLIIAAISIAELRLQLKNARQEIIFASIYFFSFLLFLTVRYRLLGEVVSRYESADIVNLQTGSLFVKYNSLLARCFVPPLASTVLFVSCYAIVFVLLLSGAITHLKKYKHDTLFFIILFGILVSLLPVVSLGIDTHDTESERYLYLPSVFICIWLVYMLMKSPVKNSLKKFVFISLILYHAIYVFSSSRDYRVAGNMSRSSLYNTNSKLKEGKIICVNRLPLQFRGAKIFYAGFKEGLSWLYQSDTSAVNIITAVEVLPQKSYFSNFYNSGYAFPFKSKMPVSTDSCNSISFSYDSVYFRQ